MAFFDKNLKPEESLFSDIVALDFDYQPKLVPYRESHQFKIAECIKPLFAKRSGRNLLIHGGPGVGKTVSLKHVLKEIKDEGLDEEVRVTYINCWKKDTSFKIVLELCNQLNYKFTQNKNTDILLKEVIKILNKTSSVLCFDEVDKLKEVDVIYSLVEDVNRKTIILITNDLSWFDKVDPRLKSRLETQRLEFSHYNIDEVKGILKQRCGYALVPGVLEENAFDLIVQKTFESKDLRKGLSFIREAGMIAEDKSSKKILLSHADQAYKNLSEKNIKEIKINKEQNEILNIVKNNPKERIGKLYEKYKKENPENPKTYKTFQRQIQKLEKDGIVKKKKVTTDKGGNSTLVEYID